MELAEVAALDGERRLQVRLRLLQRVAELHPIPRAVVVGVEARDRVVRRGRVGWLPPPGRRLGGIVGLYALDLVRVRVGVRVRVRVRVSVRVRVRVRVRVTASSAARCSSSS